MLGFLADEFYGLSQWLAKVRANPSVLLSQDGQKDFYDMVPKLYKHCDELGLALSRNKLMEIYHRVNEGCQARELPGLLGELDDRIHEELESQWFFHVSLQKVPYLRPMGAIYSEVLESKFKSTVIELEHAGSCYAFGENTASVFHSMRALEKGLRALADKLEMLPESYQLENWKNVIDAIEKRIRAMEQEPKSSTKSANVQFYSQLAVNFWYFKGAWRNHVSHSNQLYDDHEAHKVLTHVFDFLCEAANGGLAEK